MNSNNLTVIIKDTNNNLIKNAEVSILPSNITGKTDKNGQVVLALPNETKITVKVELNNISQEVPYYLTADNQNNRLEINLAYLQQIQSEKSKELLQTVPKKTNPTPIFAIIIIIIAISLIIFYLIKKNKMALTLFFKNKSPQKTLNFIMKKIKLRR